MIEIRYENHAKHSNERGREKVWVKHSRNNLQKNTKKLTYVECILETIQGKSWTLDVALRSMHLFVKYVTFLFKFLIQHWATLDPVLRLRTRSFDSDSDSKFGAPPCLYPTLISPHEQEFSSTREKLAENWMKNSKPVTSINFDPTK